MPRARRSASLFLPLAPSLSAGTLGPGIYLADSTLQGKERRRKGGGRMRGSFEVAASPVLLLSRVSYRRFPLPSSLHLRLAHRDSHGRPFRYSFVSWRLPSCPLTIPSRRLPSRSDPLEARAILFRLRRTNLLALSSVSSSSPPPSSRAPGPYVRHSRGIAPGSANVLQPCPAFVGKYGPPKVLSSLRASKIATFVSGTSRLRETSYFFLFHSTFLPPAFIAWSLFQILNMN